jgi:hypothetical protein
MADTKRSARPKFTTPRGVFKFPKLTEPDTKFKAEGEYSTKLVFPKDDAGFDALIEKLKPLHAAAIEKGEAEFAKLPIASRKKLGKLTVNPFVTEVFDKATEEPTGELELKFTRKASGVYKTGPKTGQTWRAKPDIFDAKGHEMKKPPAIWGGTVGKISFEVGDYFIPGTGAAGLTLSLMGAQIIDLVTSGGARSASAHGFGAEDGYEQAADEPSGGSSDAPAGEGDYGASPDDADF